MDAPMTWHEQGECAHRNAQDTRATSRVEAPWFISKRLQTGAARRRIMVQPAPPPPRLCLPRRAVLCSAPLCPLKSVPSFPPPPALASPNARSSSRHASRSSKTAPPTFQIRIRAVTLFLHGPLSALNSVIAARARPGDRGKASAQGRAASARSPVAGGAGIRRRDAIPSRLDAKQSAASSTESSTAMRALPAPETRGARSRAARGRRIQTPAPRFFPAHEPTGRERGPRTA